MLAIDLIDYPGMALTVVGDNLEITSQEPLTAELRTQLSEHKAEIIKLLTNQKRLPTWCSGECRRLVTLHTPQGELSGCRIETEKNISWMRISYLKGCPKKMGEAAIPYFPTSADFTKGS